MKKLNLKSLLAFVVVTLLMASCNYDEKLVTNAESEPHLVSFGICENVSTKTSYDDEDKFRINWEYGDMVKISCDLSTPKEAAYSIEKSPVSNLGSLKGDPSKSLIWNTEAGDHIFYGAYPHDKVTISGSNIRCHYNKNQVLSNVKGNNYAPVNMLDGFMVAKSVCAPLTPVSLAFTPVFTTLDIEIPVSSTSSAASVTSLSLTFNNSKKYISKTGEFTIDGSRLPDNITLLPYSDVNQEETITAQVGNVSIKPGESAIFTLFLPPVTLDANTTSITAIVNGAPMTAKLNAPAAGGSRQTIKMGSVTALESVDVKISSKFILYGSSVQLQAFAVYSDGTRKDVTSETAWSSSSTSIVTVGNSATDKGLATGKGAGNATITAAYGSTVSGTVDVVVSQPSVTVDYITVFPNLLSINVDEKAWLKAVATYKDGHTEDVTKSTSWSSSKSTIATVSNIITKGGRSTKGLVTGKAAGTTTITATYKYKVDGLPTTIKLPNIEITSTSEVTVADPATVLDSLKVTPSSSSIYKDENVQLKAIAKYKDGSTKDVTLSADWSSVSPNIATVTNSSSNSGLVTGTNDGTVVITAKFGGMDATATITVIDLAKVLDYITVTPNPASVYTGKTVQLIAKATYKDGHSAFVTNSSNWSSVSPNIATVTNSANCGIVTGKTEGTATIIVKYNTATTTVKVNVTTDPATILDYIEITHTSPFISVNSSSALGLKAVYEDGHSVFVTSSASWRSSKPSCATVGNTSPSDKGRVTGVAEGEATITATYGGETAYTTVFINYSKYLTKPYFYRWDACNPITFPDQGWLIGSSGFNDSGKIPDEFSLDVTYITPSQSCKNCPTRVQMEMYIAAGVYWDDNGPQYLCADNTYKTGGLWVKKMDYISGFDKKSRGTPIKGRPSSDVIYQYFFLPAAGYYKTESKCRNAGYFGYYWSSVCCSSYLSKSWTPVIFEFYSEGVYIVDFDSSKSCIPLIESDFYFIN